MTTLNWIIVATLVGGALSALAASSFLVLSDSMRRALLPHLIGLATGALLAAALTTQLPAALELAGPDGFNRIGLALLGGLLAFFVLEKAVLWRHCHHDDCEVHTPEAHHRDAASGNLILIGDGIHNIVDGVLIAAAFLTDTRLGVVTALAAIVHEIPQEVGDIAILLNAGWSRARALLMNLLVSVASVVGGVLGYLWLDNAQAVLPYALAVTAASFLYIAVADLIPGLHRRVGLAAGIQQLVMIGLGAGAILLLQNFLHAH